MMFRGLLRCSFPCRHAANALVAATAAGASAARMANYNHTNTEAHTLHDSLNDERLVNNSNNAETTTTPHMTRTRGQAPHFTAYYSGAAPLPRRRPSVFAPMRRPQAYTRHTPLNTNNTTTTTTTHLGVQQNMPRRRVVMSKAQQIRQAARHMREAQRAQRVNSPAAYLILSATQEQLNREAELVSATLQRLQAEKALVQARQESAEDMQQFALGIEQRRRAVHNKDQCSEAQLNYSTPHETDNNANAESTTKEEGMREGVYQAVISEPSLKQQHNTNNTTTQPSRAMTASAMDQEVQKTLAETVDAKLLGLPATADHEAALAMQRRTSHSRKSPQTNNKKKNNSITRDGNRRKKTTLNMKKAVGAVQPARRRGRPSKQQQQQTKKNNRKTNTVAKQRKPSQAPRRVGRPAKATSVRPQAKSRSRNTSTATAGKKKKSASQKRTR